ncbi:MAG: SxtJ family membrane protein [Vicinamibacterales bacterium]|jgi:hypothetical protein|nr:hypothetical protein [Acidobacteriota bacterium]MDP7294421.1 SxtJ family membrane protein [Vicinamibacterales bacterium]MDP7473219.1 SxtJ family membrane protein [Vicinamibacterales bacterium]MDP7671576.1 SxtJ family membrane protein [Vicinamibacterales bacterium]HJO38375.1 SxtJ family membrane protein [Vicinamibacterales bacterium]
MTDPWRSERQFGRAVGSVLAVAGAYLVWREAPVAGPLLFGLGAVLVILGLVAPRLLVVPNRGWMALAEALSYVSTRIILAVVFFLIVTPIGVFRRMAGSDPLGRRRPAQPTYWSPYPMRQRDPKHLEKMF